MLLRLVLGWGLPGNPQLPQSIRALSNRQILNYGTSGWVGKLLNYYSPGTISHDDLIVLAPYIQDWLNGNPPPFDLPAEYDRRLEFLDGFKKRMVSFGFWPRGAMDK
jgi:hypothetical protein